jgi:hypothetical protein
MEIGPFAPSNCTIALLIRYRPARSLRLLGSCHLPLVTGLLSAVAAAAALEFRSVNIHLYIASRSHGWKGGSFAAALKTPAAITVVATSSRRFAPNGTLVSALFGLMLQYRSNYMTGSFIGVAS